MVATTIPGLHTPETPEQAQIVTVTPETAEQWLSRNTHNRNISAMRVRQYASDMEQGRWPFTSQPIIFDSNGVLADGQHRLHAQIKANATMKWLVVTGVSAEAQNHMDIGGVRNPGQQLVINGKQAGSQVAAIARLELMRAGEPYPTKPQIQELCELKYEEYFSAQQVASRVRKAVGGPSASYGLAYCELLKIDADATGIFFDSLTTGAQLPLGSPILAVRNLISNSQGGRADTARIRSVDLLFRAWNYWRLGKTVKNLNWPATEVKPTKRYVSEAV